MLCLKQLVAESSLGEVRLGMSEGEVVTKLGAPDFSGGHYHESRRPNIWYYGDLELAFTRPDYRLSSISFTWEKTDSETPYTGLSLSVDPWILTEGLQPDQFIDELISCRIRHVKLSEPFNNKCIEFLTGKELMTHVIFGFFPHSFPSFVSPLIYRLFPRLTSSPLHRLSKISANISNNLLFPGA